MLKNKIVLGLTAVLVIAALFTSCGGAQTAQDNKIANTSVSISKGVLKSVYDGTYTGTFYYEAKEDYDYYPKGSSNLVHVYGAWVPSSFTLTLTFKTVEINQQDVWLDVTNAICSNSDFATGPSGIDPLGFECSEDNTNASFPLNPSKPDDTPLELELWFPNWSYIRTRSTNNSSGIPIKFSPDGMTLSNNPNYNSGGIGISKLQGDETWVAKCDRLGGIGSDSYALGPYYSWKFLSWSLKKVSP